MSQVDLDALEKSIVCSCNPEMLQCIQELREARERIQHLKGEVEYWKQSRPPTDRYWADYD